jgi:hypothetical protein
VIGWKRLLASVGSKPAPARPAPKGRSSATEFFFSEDRTTPLILVAHISKTAGTALRRFVRSNLAEAEIEVIQNLRYVARTPAERLDWFREWYGSLGDDRRAQLCCVMSHWAGYLLPALDRDADALTLVREPVDRTLSYFFHKQRQHPEWSLDSLERLADERGLPEWREQGDGKLLDRLFNNWQSRALLSIFHDVSTLEHAAGSPAERELWRKRLRELVDQVFLVGVQDRFEQYAAMLARRYDWQDVLVPHAKVNPQRPSSPAVSSGLRAAILDHNWLDRELHELSRRSQIERESIAAGLGSSSG